MADRLVVIGGDAAGMSAASQARRQQPYLEIVALEMGEWTSYSACGIPYLVGGDVDQVEKLVARTPEQFRDTHRIDVRLRHEVKGIDLDQRRVEVRDNGRERTFLLGFDQLHVATGARPIRPDLPGIDLPHVHGVQTLGDGAHLLRHVQRERCRSVVVIGGGYIGIEMAEAFTRRGLKVTLLEADAHVMRTLDPDLADRVATTMRSTGIDVRTGVRAQGFEPGTVLTADGSVDADLVVLGLGVTPNAELAGDAGLELGARGSIAVDRRQETSAPGVFAAGDCAQSFHRVSQRPVHVALGTVANKQGRVAGINLGGGYASFPGVVGTAVTKVCQLEIGRTGLSSAEARRAGFRFESVTIDSTTRAGYHPDTGPITVRVLVEHGSRRLIGGQVLGEDGAARRIDVLATAITAGMTVDDVIDLDLGYAPPFSSVWDAVHVAARAAASALGREGGDGGS